MKLIISELKSVELNSGSVVELCCGLRVPRRQRIALLISENNILVLTQLVASDWLQLLFREMR